MFRKINIVPRWLIFCIDLIFCGLALSLAYLLNYNFDAAKILPKEV